MDTRDPETFAILGAAFEVRRQLGGGLFEAVYRRALGIEFTLRDVPYEAEPELAVYYKARMVGRFRPDFVCFGRVVVEVKGRPALDGAHIAQTLNYLRISRASRALLLNFGSQGVDFRRFAGAPADDDHTTDP
jgi:GxxExxY protein